MTPDDLLNKYTKTYFINLDSRKDRYNESINEFKNINLTNYERFSAIKPTLQEIKKYSFLDTSKFWKRKRNDQKYIISASGCKLSHYFVLKKALKEVKNEKYILILEDDISFKNDFVKNYFNSINYIEKNNIEFNILYGHSHLFNLEKKDVTLLHDNLIKLNDTCKSNSTGCYIIPTNKLKFIINFIENSEQEIDNTYRSLRQDKFYIYPMSAVQRDSYSDILDENVIHPDYNPKLDEYLKK